MSRVSQCMEDYKESLAELEQDAVMLRLMLLGLNEEGPSSRVSALLRVSDYLRQHVHDVKTLSANVIPSTENCHSEERSDVGIC